MSQIECLIFFYRFTHFPVLDKFNIVDFWNQFFIILTVSFSVFLSFSFFCLVWRNVSTSRRSSHCSRREITYSSHLFMFSCYVWSFLMLLCLKFSHVMFEVGRFSLLQEVMLCLKLGDFHFYRFSYYVWRWMIFNFTSSCGIKCLSWNRSSHCCSRDKTFSSHLFIRIYGT